MFIILMIHVLRIAHLRIAPQEGNCEFHGAASSLMLVSSPLDYLCIDIWMSVMIFYLRTQMTKR